MAAYRNGLLSPANKRIRQKVMHRLTRAVNSQGSLQAQMAWDAMKPSVHSAVTSALLEEQRDGAL